MKFRWEDMVIASGGRPPFDGYDIHRDQTLQFWFPNPSSICYYFGSNPNYVITGDTTGDYTTLKLWLLSTEDDTASVVDTFVGPQYARLGQSNIFYPGTLNPYTDKDIILTTTGVTFSIDYDTETIAYEGESVTDYGDGLGFDLPFAGLIPLQDLSGKFAILRESNNFKMSLLEPTGLLDWTVASYTTLTAFDLTSLSANSDNSIIVGRQSGGGFYSIVVNPDTGALSTPILHTCAVTDRMRYSGCNDDGVAVLMSLTGEWILAVRAGDGTWAITDFDDSTPIAVAGLFWLGPQTIWIPRGVGHIKSYDSDTDTLSAESFTSNDSGVTIFLKLSPNFDSDHRGVCELEAFLAAGVNIKLFTFSVPWE